MDFTFSVDSGNGIIPYFLQLLDFDLYTAVYLRTATIQLQYYFASLSVYPNPRLITLIVQYNIYLQTVHHRTTEDELN